MDDGFLRNGVVRVVVVDDSPTMRRLIRTGVETHPRIRVVGEAGDAREARDAIRELDPDAITLDVEMPGMSGVDFLERLMRARPIPVIMLSTLTRAGSEASVRALSLGAIDCIEKPRFGNARATFERLKELLLLAANANIRTRANAHRLMTGPPDWEWNGRWILIGASTGGVEALETVLRVFPANCPPTLITQHMPARFLTSFAARLGNLVAPTVRLAETGLRPKQGQVLIAPGGDTHLAISSDGVTIKLTAGPRCSGHRPSVDEMFASALPFAGRMVAAILTGMGRDGAERMLDLRRAGARCIGQDRTSSVVYGMPRAAHDIGAVEQQLPLDEIGPRLLELAGK